LQRFALEDTTVGRRRWAAFPTYALLGVEVVVIAHTETEDEIRIISMRKAERHEQEHYFASR
jgi:uncharacterized DUF497 family protein